MKYWIQRWAQLRQKELMDHPTDFPINDAYKAYDELKSGFEGLHELFMRCYDDILNDPVGMLLPAYDMNEYGYFSKEARLSRDESYKYARIFYVLGYSGELDNSGGLRIEVNRLKEQCKALKLTKTDAYLNILGNYSVVAEGLVNGKLKGDTVITVSYPDNKNVITALYLLAVKSSRTDRFRDFCRLNYKLFEGDWDTVEYDNGVEAVSDFFHSERERTAALLIHNELLKRNYFYNFQDWNEGPQIRYYKKEADRNRNANAAFWLASIDTELKLFSRIANMDKALEYIKSCPQSVINSFMASDTGCANRISGKCVSGISYQLNGDTIWRCGCCNPNFQVSPEVEDHLYYIDIVELAGKKK